MFQLASLLVLFFFVSTNGFNKCAKRYTRPGMDASSMVCVCNATYCDDIIPLGYLKLDEAVSYLTSAEPGKRFHRQKWNWLSAKATKLRQTVHADPTETTTIAIKVTGSQRYQKMLGFGGAFTDAAMINLDSLTDPAARNNLMEAYFSPKGLEYTIGRIPIASCDFSTHEYSYAEVDGDFDLAHFALHAEDLQKIVHVREAVRMSNGRLKLFASPWSAPGWMKTNGRMKGGGQLKTDTMETPYHQTYANYFVRFLEEYARHNVTFWAMTVQNEPSTGADPNYGFQTMYFSPEMERDFVRDFLGPTLGKSPLAEQVHLMICDDFRGNIVQYADSVLNDSQAASYVSGIAVHWYGDGADNKDRLVETHRRHPDRFILGTEACHIGFKYKTDLGSWDRGNSYAVDIFQDLNNWVAGWVDWNLALDLEGGPNWVKNFVDSPIIVNASAGEFYKQPMFYVLGHFSKFVPPDSVRIGLSAAMEESTEQFDSVAFDTPDHHRVIVIRYSGTRTDLLEVEISDPELKGDKRLTVQLEPRSIMTIVYSTV